MIVDSSVFVEILGDGPLRETCEKAIARQTIRIPTIVIHEVDNKLKAKGHEEFALEAVAALSQNEVLDLTREVAVLAADLCLQHGISMADGVVLAHAEVSSDTLLTLDNDFSGISAARVLR